jgi:SagB-type dehydrogenase family enzyme
MGASKLMRIGAPGRLVLALTSFGVVGSAVVGQERQVISLPDPVLDGGVSLESTLSARESVREFTSSPLTLSEVSQLLWSAQGVTRGDGGRTAPSAGGLYPLEIYLVVGAVEDVEAGIYRYRPERHDIEVTGAGDHRSQLASAALRQSWMRDAAVMIVVVAQYARTTGKYGERGRKYVHMEVGHTAQSVYLQATALGLGTTFVGAFNDSQVKGILGLPAAEHPLGLMPVGRTR